MLLLAEFPEDLGGGGGGGAGGGGGGGREGTYNTVAITTFSTKTSLRVGTEINQIIMTPSNKQVANSLKRRCRRAFEHAVILQNVIKF